MNTPSFPSRKVRIAAIQDAPVSFNLSASIDKLESLVKEAASPPHSASLVVLPEAFLCCYPRGLDFGAVIGSRTPEGREWFHRYYASSVDIEGRSPEWVRIQSIARTYGVVLVLGVVEKEAASHGTLFCTAVTIGKEGELLAKRRKLMPTGSERLVWGQGDGSSVRVAETDVGKVIRYTQLGQEQSLTIFMHRLGLSSVGRIICLCFGALYSVQRNPLLPNGSLKGTQCTLWELRYTVRPPPTTEKAGRPLSDTSPPKVDASLSR